MLEKIKNGWIYSTIRVIFEEESNKYILFDGKHRIEAIKLLGEEEFNIVFPEGLRVYVYNKFDELQILSISQGN